MTEMNRYAQGQFSWADLMTPSAEQAKRFYTSLFGWNARDQAIPMGGFYTQLQLKGRSVAGLGEQRPEMKQKGAPAAWSVYVNVDDVDVIAKKVTENGGTLIMPPMDVMTEGRMLTFQDPTGAILGCWQPKKHTGAGLLGESGALSWFELMTRDVEKAKKFYSAVFGWTFTSSSMPSGTYWEISIPNGKDAPSIGGMMATPPGLEQVPPNWTPYFAVSDVNATIEKVKKLGGKVEMGPREIQGVGTFAVLSDPQGAVFDVIMTPMR